MTYFLQSENNKQSLLKALRLLFVEPLTTDISFECQAGTIRKGPFWRRATSQIRKKSPQRTNRLERARVGPAFERYRVIDSLAKRSLRFPRVFWSPAKRAAIQTPPNARRSMQCQTGSQPPAVSKASWEKGGSEYDLRARVCELDS